MIFFQFLIDFKFGEDKGNRTKLDFTFIKVNYNRCDPKKGGTIVHRLLSEIINKANKLECPIKKGKLYESGYIYESMFPAVPRMMFPSGSVRFLFKIFVRGRPATLISMINMASIEVGGTYKK